MKNAYILYRETLDLNVSLTEQQTHCRALAERLGLKITQELFERKHDASSIDIGKPDSLHAIHDDARSGKFDILLVYSTKCIGRERLETPFTINYLINSNVEVHSVLEGKQRINSFAQHLSLMALKLPS